MEGVLDRLLKIGSNFCHGDVVREGVLHWFLCLRSLSVCVCCCVGGKKHNKNYELMLKLESAHEVMISAWP